MTDGNMSNVVLVQAELEGATEEFTVVPPAAISEGCPSPLLRVLRLRRSAYEQKPVLIQTWQN